MFQLFRLGSTSVERSWPLSLRSLSENNSLNPTEKTCLLCKLLNIDSRLQIRNQSSVTHLNLNERKKNKVKRKNRHSYADIIVVTDASPRFKRANVTKLTPVDLNLLATTNISLNELYKIKDVTRNASKYLLHTYSNLTVEGVTCFEDIFVTLKPTSEPSPKIKNTVNIPPIELNNTLSKPKVRPIEIIHHRVTEKIEASEECDLENDLELQCMSVKHSLEPEIIEETSENVFQEEQDVQVKLKKSVLLDHRDTVASKTLAAYIEVCNHLRNPQRGLSALLFHQNRSKKGFNQNRLSAMDNINVYYTLLKGFANKGDYQKIEQVLNIMQESKVEPNLNCYVAILECLGRINCQNHYLKEIRIHIKEALRKGITLDRMMNEGVFLNDERQHTLNAFRAYNQTYSPTYHKPTVKYNNDLVNHLNNDCEAKLEADEPKSFGGFIEPAAMQKLVQNQVAVEEEGYLTIKSIENKGPPTEEIVQLRTTLNEHYQTWAESARIAFNRDLATLTAQRSALSLEPYLRSIPPEDFVEIIVQEAKKMAQGSESYSPEVSLLNRYLGQRVYSRYRVARKQRSGVLEKVVKIHTKYCQNYVANRTELDVLPDHEVYTNPRSQWQLLEHDECENGTTLNMGHQPWVSVTFTAIGKFLYHIIMHDLKVDVNCLNTDNKNKNYLPAFYTIFRSQGRIVKEEVKPHPVLSRLYKASEPETLTFPANEVPMLCPPIPWTSVDNGGYVISPTDVVRLPFQASTQKKRMAEAEARQLYPNLDALNQLGAVPWKVNPKILDVILKVFRTGGSSKLDVPEPPSSLPPPPSITPDMDKAEKYQAFRQKFQHRRKKAEMYSLWCDCLYRLSLANHFRNDVFWLPHNMDFRGRVYPVPPHLNHLGSDLARSMLVFAEARPLGPNGLDWLKIHLINLTGLKKRNSVQDRLNFANDMIDLILDSADNPINGKKWWAQSDEPWQTLACCMEIADVIRSGINPAEYRSHFPVHQDGSCNGLQHYAALGRDSAGAFSVNLAPSKLPQDVYSAVVALVEEQRAKDEADGVEIAKTLNGFIKRKVIKQTIMTTVYGVTRFGARLQIARQLKDIDDFPKEAVWEASSYLTVRTFDSLRTMFTSTREIQDWFTECARLISGVNGSLLEWVTPLGLPVVQPYIKYKKTSMPAGYEGFSLDQFEKPNVMKQKNAFPPNFVHSLDSSHMMLTSLHCERAGITFVSVHDCYWTHPSTINIMNKICREQFVALHSEPILENLSVDLYDLYAYDERNLTGDGSVTDLSKKKLNKVLKQLPKKGDFDIRDVLNSIYFFS